MAFVSWPKQTRVGGAVVLMVDLLLSRSQLWIYGLVPKRETEDGRKQVIGGC